MWENGGEKSRNHSFFLHFFFIYFIHFFSGEVKQKSYWEKERNGGRKGERESFCLLECIGKTSEKQQKLESLLTERPHYRQQVRREVLWHTHRHRHRRKDRANIPSNNIAISIRSEERMNWTNKWEECFVSGDRKQVQIIKLHKSRFPSVASLTYLLPSASQYHPSHSLSIAYLADHLQFHLIIGCSSFLMIIHYQKFSSIWNHHSVRARCTILRLFQFGSVESEIHSVISHS